jgi:ribose transport system substrate-binding protein
MNKRTLRLICLFAAVLFAFSIFSVAAQTKDVPAVYKMLPKNSLSGVYDPNMKDRLDVPKAWPKTPKDRKKITIGWTEITLGNPWFVAVKFEAEKLAKKYGFDLSFLVADSDVQKQSQQIETFVTNRVDIIVVDPCDVQGPVSDIKRAVDAGIPVVCLGTVPDASAPILTTISPDPFGVGYVTGEYIGAQYKADQEIKSALIIGVMGNSTSESRLCGTISGIIAARQKAMKKFTSKEDAMLVGYNLFENVKKTGKCSAPEWKFSVLAWGVGKWTEDGGLEASETILTAVGSQINIIIPDNDFMGAGALKAIAAVNKTGQIQVACPADGDRNGLELVKSGAMMCTGTFAGGQTGAATMEFIKQIFIDGKDANNLPMGSFFPPLVFTKDNVAQYIDPDMANTFYKVPPFKYPRSIPEIKASLK